MTFKEKLTVKANLIESGSADEVRKNIDYLSSRMEEFAIKREYTICLVVPHCTMAIGSANTNCSSFFVPKKLNPEQYRAMYIEELRKLGFDNFELSNKSDKWSDDYNIKVRW